MKTNIVKSTSIGNSAQCRMDAKYNSFVSNMNWTTYPNASKHCKISDVLISIPIAKQKKGDIDDDVYVINISDQIAGYGRLIDTSDFQNDAIGSDKNILTDCDIMVSKLGMPRGYIFLKPQYDGEIIGSSEFIPYKIKDITESKFYLYLLLTKELRNAYACLESGKTPSHKRVNPEEFIKIRIPHVEHDKILSAIEQIEKCEQKIDEQLSLKHPIELIINKVFSDEFGFSENLYNTFGKGMSYGTQKSDAKGIRISNVSSSKIMNSDGLRLSARVNNDITSYLTNIVNEMPHLYVKDILTETIHRGTSPAYDENGDVSVVKTAHLKNGDVIISDEEFVQKSFFDKKEKAQVRKGDILLASTGKPSIGKIDLYDEDVELFADGHISIIRIDEKKYNKQFFVYWFRCILGYFQIERDYVGCTNQVELYENEIKEFIIPDIPLSRQEEIVSIISEKIQIQKDAEIVSKKYRAEIDKIIEDAIE